MLNFLTESFFAVFFHQGCLLILKKFTKYLLWIHIKPDSLFLIDVQETWQWNQLAREHLGT